MLTTRMMNHHIIRTGIRIPKNAVEAEGRAQARTGLGGHNLAQQCFDVPAAPNHMKNQYVLRLDAVQNDVLTDGETTEAGAQLLIPGAAEARVAGKEKEARSVMESISRLAISKLPLSLAT